MENKRPIYSKNEKILRIICFLGIIICEIIGILLFFVNNIVGGIVVILSCIVSSFLVSSFFTLKIKSWFSNKSKKRAIYAAFYALIILVCMVTTVIVCLNMTYSAEALTPPSIELAENTIKGENVKIKIIETDLYEFFEVGDSYYFALETKYELSETGGAVSTHYPVTYVKANKYTGSLTIIDFVQYENAKTFIK
ncbi:MAG: hypothetical protein E7596_05130 [Ruminococcaceae bacterium]|nr:hypothetical protein [Oscillospiraceae bacterium]